MVKVMQEAMEVKGCSEELGVGTMILLGVAASGGSEFRGVVCEVGQ